MKKNYRSGKSKTGKCFPLVRDGDGITLTLQFGEKLILFQCAAGAQQFQKRVVNFGVVASGVTVAIVLVEVD